MLHREYNTALLKWITAIQYKRKLFPISFQRVRTKDLKGSFWRIQVPPSRGLLPSAELSFPEQPHSLSLPYTSDPTRQRTWSHSWDWNVADVNGWYFVQYLDHSWSREMSIAGVDSLGSNVGLTWQLGKPARVLGNTFLCRDWGLGESRARGHAGSSVSIKGTPVYYVVEERLELWESE
jgi:hypothetical protein